MLHIEPEFTEIPSEILEHLEKFREEHAGDAIGNVAQTVLFEDEKVRDWIEEHNPTALIEMAERLQEAIDRGLWTPRSNSARARIDQITAKRS